MKIDEIYNEWMKDSSIQEDNLSEEALKIPKLHHKYFRLLSKERLELNALVEKQKQLKRIKLEYYNGTLSQHDLGKYGWEPFQKKLLKGDINNYIESDDDVIKSNIKISLQKEKVLLLESIIKIIMNRGFHIKSAIDFIKFVNGAN